MAIVANDPKNKNIRVINTMNGVIHVDNTVDPNADQNPQEERSNNRYVKILTDIFRSAAEYASKQINYPAAPDGMIMGLPVHMTSSEDPFLYNIFIQSFPIMTIKAFKIKRSDNSTDFDKERYEKIPGGGYKFAIMNEGGTGININNEFGPCVMETQFENIVNNDMFKVIGEMNQMTQSNAMIGSVIANGYQTGSKLVNESAKEMLDNAKNALANQLNSNNATVNGAKNDIISAAGNVMNMISDALTRGSRIDIPDIWKSSSGGVTANVKIRLRCRCAGAYDNQIAAEEDFRNQILIPLQILLLLSCPLRMSDGRSNGGGITYENPPYLEISIDKIFESKCCAIRSMSVTFDYMRESYCTVRPMAADVSLTIQDMYKVVVMDKDSLESFDKPPETDMIPSSKRILGNLNDPSRKAILPGLEYSLLQGHGDKVYGEFGYNTNFNNGSVDTFDKNLGSSNTGVLSDLSGQNDILRNTEPGIDEDWYNLYLVMDAEEWENILKCSNEYNNIFENAWYEFNSAGGFDFGVYDPSQPSDITIRANGNVELLANNETINASIIDEETIKQRYGNFDLNSKMKIDNYTEIVAIPIQMVPYFNGLRSEIRDYVPKIDYDSETFTDYVSLERDNIQIHNNDDVEKLDKMFDITYYKYRN